MFIEVETVEMLFVFINKRMFHFQFELLILIQSFSCFIINFEFDKIEFDLIKFE